MASLNEGEKPEDHKAVGDIIAGSIMDGTAANVLAGSKLEAAFPGWVSLICVAHSLNLVIKDLLNTKHAPQLAALVTATCKIAAHINDTESTRALMQSFQVSRPAMVPMVLRE